MATWNQAPLGLTRRLGGLFSDSSHDSAPRDGACSRACALVYMSG